MIASGTHGLIATLQPPPEKLLCIDEIDRILAKHYGFTDEELDFILLLDKP